MSRNMIINSFISFSILFSCSQNDNCEEVKAIQPEPVVAEVKNIEPEIQYLFSNAYVLPHPSGLKTGRWIRFTHFVVQGSQITFYNTENGSMSLPFESVKWNGK